MIEITRDVGRELQRGVNDVKAWGWKGAMITRIKTPSLFILALGIKVWPGVMLSLGLQWQR